MSWEDGFAFSLTEEDVMVRETARAFAVKAILPEAARIDHEHAYPAEIIADAASLGFLGAAIPEEYGGTALSAIAFSLLIEELAAACASTSIIVSAHNSLAAAPIVHFGSEEQKQAFLPAMADGSSLGCFALSEPSTGSDAAALQCTVVTEGDEYVINGTKNWITNGAVAGTVVVFATHDCAKGYKGVSAFVHKLDIEGVLRGKLEDKLGICGSPTCSLTYENVRLPKSSILGKEGDGFRIAMHTLNGGRIGVAAQAVGIARAALRDAARYSKERVAFGKEICQHQSIQNYIADMVCQVEAARYLTLAAAARKDNGENYIRQAAMAKLFASEAAMKVADRGIQIHGGYGYVKDFPAERHLRDAKITEIYEGTSEIQRFVIASRFLEEVDG